MATNTSPDRHWVWFDGPVDTLWIESMNTVLDDNKKLCLMSGEIIAMSGTMSMIFENMDLSQASPATVSRCGMIYLEPVQLGWRPLRDSWLDALPEAFIPALKELILLLFETFVDPLLEFVQRHCTFLMPVDDLMLVNNLLRYFLAITAVPFSTEKNAKVLDGWTRGAFLFSVVWSIGAALNNAGRTKFDEYVYPVPACKIQSILFHRCGSPHPLVRTGTFDYCTQTLSRSRCTRSNFRQCSQTMERSTISCSKCKARASS
jgi:dynein heavy chain